MLHGKLSNGPFVRRVASLRRVLQTFASDGARTVIRIALLARLAAAFCVKRNVPRELALEH